MTNWLDGAKFFIFQFAFEHQGRSPEFAPAGLAALEEVALVYHASRPTQEFFTYAWEAFCFRIACVGARGAKETHNPFNPWKSRGLFSLCSSLIRDDFNIYAFVRRSLDAGDIDGAYRTIKQIRGVGNKESFIFLA
jgi:hypothetical protein